MTRYMSLLSLSLALAGGMPSPARAASVATPPNDGFSFPFPIHSLKLLPARKALQLELPALDRPLFLIGDDAVSRRWLSQQLQRLRRSGAVGLVVEVESAERFDVLRRLASGLELNPAVGDALAEHFGFSHYPALLLPAGREP